jgi:predicted nucleic acid-binding protein
LSQFVLDASMALSWCFEDETDQMAERVLDSLTESEALVPAIWFLEVANGLLAAERKKRTTPARVDECLDLIGALPVIVDVDAYSTDVIGLARKAGLSAYDAAYLELAIRHALPLATRDRALRLAAEKVGIVMFPTEA